ncbi:hypothetical protein CE91St14_17420 [Porphyromonas somerae]|nr:hypothetical protein CE91St14_17420 [Porphyromonas somerae]
MEGDYLLKGLIAHEAYLELSSAYSRGEGEGTLAVNTGNSWGGGSLGTDHSPYNWLFGALLYHHDGDRLAWTTLLGGSLEGKGRKKEK